MNDRENLFNTSGSFNSNNNSTDSLHNYKHDDNFKQNMADNSIEKSKDDNRSGKKSGKKNRKKRSRINGFLAFILLISIIFNIAFIYKFGIKELFVKDEKSYSLQEISDIKNEANDELLSKLSEHLGNGNGLLSFLKSTYTNKIIYTDKGKYVIEDINSSLKPNAYKKGSYDVGSNSEITYSEDGKIISHKGIDLSKYQGAADFSKIKASGVEFAMLRCGYRSYGSGILTEDSSFKTYASDASDNDIKIGVYFFSQAINTNEAREEAKFVIDMVRPYKISYPIAIDIEEVKDEYRQQNLSKKELTDVIITFCDEIKKAGYTPMIYSNIRCFAGKVDLTRLEDYEKWFAGYDSTPYYPYAMSMWQYTDSGTVDGIEGNVDLDISYKTWN